MLKYKFSNNKNFFSCRIRKYFSNYIENIFNNKKLQEFNDKGYTILPKVFSEETIEELKQEVDKSISNADMNEIKSVFDPKHSKNDDLYFLDSGDKIRYFLEKDVVDEEGNLKMSLKECTNKIGHALHDLNPKFKKFSYSEEVKHIAKTLGYLSPIIVQSMYIFKSARVGGAVGPHTDNTFLRTNPLSCTGVWVAFDDATIENGGMWGIPGSHKKKTECFMRRKDEDGRSYTYFTPEEPKNYNLNDNVVPLEAKKGSVVLLHGDFVHFSKENTSGKRRHAYTLHMVESRNHIWEADNWLQRKDVPFNFLYEN